MPRTLIRAPILVLVMLGVLLPAPGAFGATTLLGNQTVQSKKDSDTAGRAEAFRTVATASGTLTQLTVYLDASSSATKLTAGVYGDSNGRPGALLGQGTINSPAAGGWNNVPIAGAQITIGSSYWIAILSPNGSGVLQFRIGSGGASETSASSNLTALPSTWSTGSRYPDGPLAAYGSGDTSPTPILQVTPPSLSFAGQVGGTDPAAAQVSVANGGGGSLFVTAASDSSWLLVMPGSGSAPQTLQVSASLAGLSAGTYTGHITVTASGVSGSPATVTVTFQVAPPASPSALDWPQIERNPSRTGDAVGETVIGPSNVSTLRPSWSTTVDGKVTAQPLFLKQVSVAGQVRDVVIAATSANSVYALDTATGQVLWRKNFGAEGSNVAIPGGFGVTGTPAVDKANGRIYAVADDGRLHALSISDGSDVASPLAVVTGPTTNKVWGGLNLVGSDLYIATASDGGDTPPWRGRVYHLSVAGSSPQIVGTWDVVPGIAAPNGGGGIWGYGGVAVDTANGNVYAASGADSNEKYTPYANQVVALTPGLSLLGSYLPPEPNNFPCNGNPCDLDFGATPVVYQASGCPTLTATGNKNGNVYVIRASDLAASATPLQAIQLNPANDWLGSGGVGGTPAYWAAGRMLFVSDVGTGVGSVAGGIVGLSILGDCTLQVAWSKSLGGNTLPDSTPTVANGVVYVGEGNGGAVHAYDGQSGAQLWSSGAFGSSATFAAPIVADGKLIFGSWNGQTAGDAGTIRAYAPGPPDTMPPTVSITAPATGATVSGTTTVSATAADNVGVVGVQFKLDGNNLGSEVTSSPYSTTWDTTSAAAGQHMLTAVARDAAGNTTTSTSVTVTVDNSAPPPPPIVLLGDQAIESQSDSNVAGQAEAFRATAGNSGTVSQLNVYLDSTSSATTVLVGVYNDSTGHPGNLLAQASLSTPAKGTWNQVPLPSAVISNGATYWIAILGPTGAGTVRFRDRAGAGVSETSASATLTSLPSTWVTGKGYTDDPVSAYVLGRP
jgi:outer membrane protein assembly factor BamB